MERTAADQEVIKEIEHAALKNGLSRARSLTAGTCFNGMVEIIMRGDGDIYLWAFLNPAEVYDHIHQLAAVIGCTVEIKKRTDGYKFGPAGQTIQQG